MVDDLPPITRPEYTPDPQAGDGGATAKGAGINLGPHMEQGEKTAWLARECADFADEVKRDSGRPPTAAELYEWFSEADALAADGCAVREKQ